MKLSIPIELVEELQSYRERVDEGQTYIDYWRESMDRLCLSMVKDTERRKERNISYLEDHDWHIYKSEDWIQKLEESDWS